MAAAGDFSPATNLDTATTNYGPLMNQPSPDIVLALTASKVTSEGLVVNANYGLTAVDMAAPGESILSTCPVRYGDPAGLGLGSCYFPASGTVRAASIVAGVAAVMKKMDPTLTATEIKALIMGSVTTNSAYSGNMVTGNDAACIVPCTPLFPHPCAMHCKRLLALTVSWGRCSWRWAT